MDQVPFNPSVLRVAYAQGFFPMPDPDTNEILWYNPDPRAVIPLDQFHCSKSLRRSLNNRGYEVSFDRSFTEVMRQCAARKDTWISPEFVSVYSQVHAEGWAHSVEVWREKELVGGVYGIKLGGAFFAESKFHVATDASKVALYYLVERMRQRGMSLLEVQFITPHLRSLGAIEIEASKYFDLLADALKKDVALV